MPNEHEHVPVILHRSGGPSAAELNYCQECGEPIKPSGYIDHTCSDPACIDPMHLREVTKWVTVTEEEEKEIRENSKAHGFVRRPLQGTYKKD